MGWMSLLGAQADTRYENCLDTSFAILNPGGCDAASMSSQRMSLTALLISQSQTRGHSPHSSLQSVQVVIMESAFAFV